MRKNHIAGSRRARIFAKYNGRCVYCGDPANDLEHILPVAYRQDDTDENLVPACGICNHIAGPQVFGSFQEKRNYILEKRETLRWKRKILEQRSGEIPGFIYAAQTIQQERPEQKRGRPKGRKTEKKPTQRRVSKRKQKTLEPKPRGRGVKNKGYRRTSGRDFGAELGRLVIRLYDFGESCMAEILEVYHSSERRKK